MEWRRLDGSHRGAWDICKEKEEFDDWIVVWGGFLTSIQGSMQFLCASFGISLISCGLHWLEQRSYSDLFSRAEGAKSYVIVNMDTPQLLENIRYWKNPRNTSTRNAYMCKNWSSNILIYDFTHLYRHIHIWIYIGCIYVICILMNLGLDLDNWTILWNRT